MAAGRMIAKEIAHSEKVGRVTPLAALLYTWGMSHTCVEGRLDAGPGKLRMYLGEQAENLTREQLEGLRDELERSGAWIVYEANGSPRAQVTNFHRHNNANRTRETPSNIPPPPGYCDTCERLANNRKLVFKDGASHDQELVTHAQCCTNAAQLLSNAAPVLHNSSTMHEDSAQVKGSKAKTREVEVSSKPHDDDRPRGGSIRTNDLIWSWRSLFERVNDGSAQPIAPPPLPIYLAESLIYSVPALQYAADREELVEELKRICAVYEAKEWPILKAEGIIGKVGQTFDKVPEEIQEPVWWQRPEKPAGPVAEPIRKLTAGIGKEVPDA